MKKFLLLLTLLLSIGFAQNKMPIRFQAVPLEKTQMLQSGQGKLFCPNCGMTLPMFYKTNHAVDDNGTIKQFCSLHCLVSTMDKHHLNGVKVVETNRLKFIDAKSAWYVVGSRKSGTMSKISKYAFSTQKEAQTFAKEFSGEVKSFEEVISFVKDMLQKENQLIAKKQTMMAEKGKILYEKICKPTTQTFNSVSEAKSYLKSEEICGKIRGKKLQAIALYLEFKNKKK